MGASHADLPCAQERRHGRGLRLRGPFSATSVLVADLTYTQPQLERATPTCSEAAARPSPAASTAAQCELRRLSRTCYTRRCR